MSAAYFELPGVPLLHAFERETFTAAVLEAQLAKASLECHHTKTCERPTGESDSSGMANRLYSVSPGMDALVIGRGATPRARIHVPVRGLHALNDKRIYVPPT